MRFSPSREAEALDAETGPMSVPMEPLSGREPFRPPPVDDSVDEEEDADRAPPAPRVAPPDGRRAFAGTARRVQRGRSRGGWRWVAAALVVLAAAALALGYFGLVPLDVRGLAATVGLSRPAGSDGSAGGASSETPTPAPMAVTDSAVLEDTAATPDTVSDTATSNAPTLPPDTPRAPGAAPDTAREPATIRPLSPPPPPDPVPFTEPAVQARPVDSMGTSPDVIDADSSSARLPAGITTNGPVVLVPGLPIASLDESPTGHDVVHRLEGGELLMLSATHFGGGPADAAAATPVRVTTLPGDTAVGTARVGAFMVSARANVSADALQGLLRRLVVVGPARQ